MSAKQASSLTFALQVLEDTARAAGLLNERPELVQVSRTVWIRADKVTAFDAARKGWK